MRIYFAGLSGISNLDRLRSWINKGMKKKLISFYEIQKGDGVKEFQELIQINEDILCRRKR
jgi:hypothetical protein